MRNASIFFLYTIYIFIVQAAPLGPSGLLSIGNSKIWITPAETPQSGHPAIQRDIRQHGHAPHKKEIPMVTTTRTITRLITHTVPWSPLTSNAPSNFQTIAAKNPTISNTDSPQNRTHLFWDLEQQPPAALTTTSILYVAVFIMCISVLYIIIHILCTLSRHRNFRRYCCFWSTSPKENNLRGVELEESAGVSWTEGSNVTTPYPEMRAPGEWAGGWADMVAVGGAEAFGSTGRAGVSSVGGTVRRKKSETTSTGSEGRGVMV